MIHHPQVQGVVIQTVIVETIAQPLNEVVALHIEVDIEIKK